MTDISPNEGNHKAVETKLGYSPVADIPHRLRAADTDPKAAKRAERQIASMFLLSMLFVVLFVVAYIAIDTTTTVYIPVMGEVGASQVALGFTMAAAIFLIGPTRQQVLRVRTQSNGTDQSNSTAGLR